MSAVAQPGDTLEYHVLDVFTDVAFAGNPLAVVLGTDGLPTAALQTLAREFQLSETAFPQQPTDEERAAGADYRLRIFTPEVELPFAGHPSIGTAWLLHQLGRVGGCPVRQACGAGVVTLDVSGDGRRVTLTGGTPSARPLDDPAPALAAAGLTSADLVDRPVLSAGAGLDFAVVSVTASALARAIPDAELLRQVFAHPNDQTGVYLVAWDDAAESTPATAVRARLFAGDIGVTEDAATGSAALALGAAWPLLAAASEGTHRLDIVQGVEMGRPSQLAVSVDVVGAAAVRVTVSGAAVAIAAGAVRVPGV